MRDERQGIDCISMVFNYFTSLSTLRISITLDEVNMYEQPQKCTLITVFLNVFNEF